MRAMILAAGYGTRLWPLTVDRAKPAIPFMGRPLVGYMAEYLAGYGFGDVVVNLHHRAESVRRALGDGSRFGVRLHYVEEPDILGTSGALDNARHLLEGDAFVVANGKLATDIDLTAALETHRRTGALATLVLRRNRERDRYSIVEAEGDRVTGFAGFPASDNVGDEEEAPLMFTGIQVLDGRVFDLIPRGKYSDSVPTIYKPTIERGDTVAAHIAEGTWYELSTVKRYLDTSVALMKREGRDVELGEGSQVSPGASVSESVLWEGVKIAPGARVRRAVLGAGVEVGPSDVFEEVAVVRADLVAGEERPEKGLAGEVRGTNFVAPLPR